MTEASALGSISGEHEIVVVNTASRNGGPSLGAGRDNQTAGMFIRSFQDLGPGPTTCNGDTQLHADCDGAHLDRDYRSCPNKAPTDVQKAHYDSATGGRSEHGRR